MNVKDRLPSPRQLRQLFPLDAKTKAEVESFRGTIKAIMKGQDPRLLVIVGPCSIHDPKGALDYATRLKALSEQLKEKLFIVMRVYLQKPRTNRGWKGFLYDPEVKGQDDLSRGLELSRSLMLQISQLGMPIATEFLDPITPQYLSDLVSWAAIGARTSESQLHRELGSALNMPVGFKNGTSGNIQIAIAGVNAASSPHEFLSIDLDGQACVIQAPGNPYAHVVLRGAQSTPNYEKKYIEETVQKLQQLGHLSRLMIDCSHGNSGKDPSNQLQVIEDIAQRLPEEPAIFGIMIESYLKAGRQCLDSTPSGNLEYGVSITDACLGWEETEGALKKLAE